MSLRAWEGMARTAMNVVRHHPLAWMETILWYGVLACVMGGGASALQSVRNASVRMGETAGIHVILAPEASGLAALSQAIRALPGVRDARFVVRPLRVTGVDDIPAHGMPRQAMYVATTVDADTVASVAETIRGFPQVDDVLYTPSLLAGVADGLAAHRHLRAAAWGVVIAMVMTTSWWGCGGLVRGFTPHALAIWSQGGAWWRVATPAGMVGGAAAALGALVGWSLAGAVTAVAARDQEALGLVHAVGPALTGYSAALGALSACLGTAIAAFRRSPPLHAGP